MDWPVFFNELVNFLPKKISLLPSYRISLIIFTLVLIIGFWIYKRGEKRRRQLMQRVPSEIVTFGDFVYVFCVIGVALACGNLAFKSQFYLDNIAVNGKWMVYRNWGFI